MAIIGYLVNTIGLISLGAVIYLAMLAFSKMQKIKELQAMVENLEKSLETMDEQAKLVIRTDMELNKTQEELDKKITGLYTLQKISRAISTTLEEEQVFKMIDSSYLEDLGFEKAIGFLWNASEKKFSPCINIGYTKEETEAIQSLVDGGKTKYLDLIKNQKAVSADTLISATGITTPILPKEGAQGFLFVGTENPDISITEGDKELITILSHQLSQALDNARLFDKTWQAHQELEERVTQRTRELSKALEEVKKISDRKTNFVSSVSHELRTPLTSIKGYASILLTEKLGKLPEEVRLRLEKINRHSDELAGFVNDLLDISRIESGRMTMKLEIRNLKEIVDEVIELLSVQAKEKEITLSVDIAPDANSIFADLGQIKRVFINIIANALKFTPKKGKITISSRKTDQGIQIDIADTGCGIPQEAKNSIFEEFYRVDNAINQEVKGTGLGLSLVKNIIEAHKGKIWVASKTGSGSTFSLLLPQKI